MQDGVLWTNLTRSEIAAGLAQEGFPVSVTVVDRLLEEHHMGQRKPQRIKTMRNDPDRNEQFEHIAELRQEFAEDGLPILSMDTKKREILGDFVRPGRVLSSAPLRAWDHDYASHRLGVVIPHGLYDLGLNEGYLHLGDSSRNEPLRGGRADRLVSELRSQSLSRGSGVALVVRRRRQQWLSAAGLQRGIAARGRSHGHGHPRGPLPARLLEIQSRSNIDCFPTSRARPKACSSKASKCSATLREGRKQRPA